MLPRQRRRDNRRTPPANTVFVDSLLGRMFALSAVMFLGFGVLAVRLLFMGLLHVNEPEDNLRTALATPSPYRGEIRDAQDQLLATTLQVKSLFADPVNVLDVQEVTRRLPTVLTELSAAEITEKLNTKRRFVWLKRHLTPQQVYAINLLGLPGLGFREEEHRFYPNQRMVSHVLGVTNYQNEGVAGVELVAEETLQKGQNVSLTLDLRLQHALYGALQHAVAKTKAKGAWGVTLDAATGHILAMVSLPDYDANAYSVASEKAWLNRAVGGVYEMGSIFKLFTHAMGFEEGTLNLYEKFDCTKPLRIGRFQIHDFYPKNDWLTAEEIFVHSSNIGAAQIADEVGAEKQQAYLANLGFFDRYETGAGRVAASLAPERWGRIQTMSVSYGHGIAVTAVQMAAAARTVLVDGLWKQPVIVSGIEEYAPRRIFSAETVRKMRQLSAAVVQEGTGRLARVAGYNVGGKTGTSEKNTGGQYVKDKNLASFVGAIPLQAPKLITLVMVDEPNEGGGGSAAAPVFAEFSKKAMAILGIPPEGPAEPQRFIAQKPIIGVGGAKLSYALPH